jgi:hypothetical protein
MSELNRADRLQIMLTPDEISALDDWRFAHRMPSRAAAIRELLRLGLAVEGIDLATAGKRSTQFGVLEPAPEKRNDNSSTGRGSRPSNGA